MAVRVICGSRAASASTMLYQRRPTSGISSTTTKIASAAQRKSSSEIADETWRQSICRETYQKHAPVTSSLTVTIAAFSTLRCDGRGVRSEEHTSELQSRFDLVCRLLLEKKN